MGRGWARHQTAQGLISPAIILGLGFTGQRVARRLLLRGNSVSAIVRAPERFSALESIGLKLLRFGAETQQGGVLCHAIPPLPEQENSVIRRDIEKIAPKRIVYISSTGVYGRQNEVDSTTAAAPDDERGRRRIEEEDWVRSGPWSSLILRAAAIYGPERGVHAAIRSGRIPRGRGSGVVSRIHVDDLAAIAYAGSFSEIEGAWPVADELPCPSSEIAHWTARLLQVTEPVWNTEKLDGPGRRVDGRGIREALGIELIYPTWQPGVLASLAEEKFGKIRREPG
jgi:nucleoside-diphosphate-sugar epimerase